MPETSPVDGATNHPLVSVVIATRNRPDLLRQAVDAIDRQTYAGPIDCVLVFDQCEPDTTFARSDHHRSIRVIANDRSPGLAGARNSGIAAARGQYVAFCDDDDVWRPGKLGAQVALLERDLDAEVVVTGVTIHYGRRRFVRTVGRSSLTHADLVRDRVFAAHPSSVVVRRAALAIVGGIDEDLPGSYGEDRDWLLRAAAREPVRVVDEPLVDVLWHRASFFADRWRTIIEAIDYGLAKHADLYEDQRGRARLYGRKAFAHAALGNGREARRWAWRSLRCNWLDRRAYAALAVSSRAVSADRLMRVAHSVGRGI